jgi:hypothetical protein
MGISNETRMIYRAIANDKQEAKLTRVSQADLPHFQRIARAHEDLRIFRHPKSNLRECCNAETKIYELYNVLQMFITRAARYCLQDVAM